MNRTQIYLPKRQLTLLRQASQKLETTVSAIIRAIIEEKLEQGQPDHRHAPAETLQQAARRINRLDKAGPGDLASNLDNYLYGRS